MKMLELSDRWAQVLLSQPETGMGYQVATVTLSDGRQFPKTVIDSGYITSVGGKQEIPFRQSDIESIVVDHEK
jgi:hypothetical protein